MRPAEMVPVFDLAFRVPVVHRHERLRTQTKDSTIHPEQIEVSRLADCGRTQIDYIVRYKPRENERYGKITWRTEIASWMQHRHAVAMGAHHCKICWPGVECTCVRCESQASSR